MLKRYGGTQDNGVMRSPGGLPGDWYEILDGDGFYVLVDPHNPSVIYAEYPWGSLEKSFDGGGSWTGATGGIPGSERRDWCMTVVIDPGSIGHTRTTRGHARRWRSRRRKPRGQARGVHIRRWTCSGCFRRSATILSISGRTWAK